MDYKNQIVEKTLKYHPETRTDDKLLILQVWERCGFHLSVNQRKAFLGKELPSTETIRRTRQRLQQEGKYLPPQPVQEARQQKAEQIRQEIVERPPKLFDRYYL